MAFLFNSQTVCRIVRATMGGVGGLISKRKSNRIAVGQPLSHARQFSTKTTFLTLIALPLDSHSKVVLMYRRNYWVGNTQLDVNLFDSITHTLGHPLPVNDTRNFSRTY